MALRGDGQVALVTGASSGIGQACAVAFAQAGFKVAIGARRMDRLSEVAQQLAGATGQTPWSHQLDVTDVESCERFVTALVNEVGQVNVLLNNAGLASGASRVADAMDDRDWELMLNTNVLGLLRMSRLIIPHIVRSGGGHVINIGSIAGHEAYAGGSAYCGTKFAVRAITTALRQELLGQPIRVTSVDPGMVETEFSIVRYYGNEERARQVYQGMHPLSADDIADCVLFAATRPVHVNIDTIVVTSVDQAGARMVHRQPADETE